MLYCTRFHTPGNETWRKTGSYRGMRFNLFILPVLPVLATSTSTESSNPLTSLPTFSTNAGGCLTFAFGSSEGLILGVVLPVCRHTCFEACLHAVCCVCVCVCVCVCSMCKAVERLVDIELHTRQAGCGISCHGDSCVWHELSW